MKRLLKGNNIFIGAAAVGAFALAIGLTYLLFTDAYSQGRFRTMQDEISSHHKVDLTGLRAIQASGGPSINFPDLKKKLAHIKRDIIIVDSIRQYHGYIGDIPTTFFAYESQHPDWWHLMRRIIYTGTAQIRPELVTSEASIAERYGFSYKNIKIDSKVITPDEAVDEFVSFIDDLPQDAWVHFHCRLGRGRTSIMLIMLDIMKNAPDVALQDIVMRQYLLGSENLFNTVARRSGTYHSATLTRRKRFIEDFYAFICQRKAGGIQKWSEWRRLRTRTQ